MRVNKKFTSYIPILLAFIFLGLGYLTILNVINFNSIIMNLLSIFSLWFSIILVLNSFKNDNKKNRWISIVKRIITVITIVAAAFLLVLQLIINTLNTETLSHYLTLFSISIVIASYGIESIKKGSFSILD